MHPKRCCFLIAAVIAFVSFVASSSYATNGWFAHGYGVKNKGLAGAGIALPLSALAAATNPAGMVFVGHRYDISVALFSPNRQYTVTGNPSGFPGTFGLTPGTVESGSKAFIIPALAANWMLDDNSSIGVSIFGNGGMNTNYNTKTFYGSTPTGVNLMQLFIAPTYARKLAAKHAIGVTAILAFQLFKAEGLQAFGSFSRDASKMTNNNNDNSLGYGARIGYQGEWLPNVSVGASYQTKSMMGAFDSYAGLFAEKGDFDIPANWSAGVAIKASSALTVVFDVQQILYSGSTSVNNPLSNLIVGSKLGDDNGPGFGWEDMTIFKGGLQWQSGGWTWRTGYSSGEQRIPKSEVLFNILAPGVIEQHATFGFTKATGNSREISLSVMHAFAKSVAGANPLEAPGQQTIELKMNQWEFEIGFSF